MARFKPTVVRLGDRVHFNNADRTVVGLEGTAVRLVTDAGAVCVVTLAYLIASAGFYLVEEGSRRKIDDPLLTWLRTKAGYQGAIIADPRNSSPLLKSTPLRLSGWTHSTPTRKPRHRARMSRKHMADLRARKRQNNEIDTESNTPLQQQSPSSGDLDDH